MIKKIDHHGSRPATYRSTESGIEYDEFKGGFSWPAHGHHGYVCVIGSVLEDKRLRLVVDELENGLTKFAQLLKRSEREYIDAIRWWIAPMEGKNEEHFEGLYKICKREGFTLKCDQPTVGDNLQYCADLVNDEVLHNKLWLPDSGPLPNLLPKLSKIDLDDRPDTPKLKPIVVAARVIYEFPDRKKRVERDQKIDGWAEGFEDVEPPYDWMEM